MKSNQELERSSKLEDQYELYLRLSELDESRMNKIQRIETKRAWMAGAGQMLLYFKNQLSEASEGDALSTMMSMEEQVTKFWQEEAG